MPDDNREGLKIDWGSDAKMHVVKTQVKAEAPRGPEELRSRLTLMGIAYDFLASAQSNSLHLKGAGQALFREYLDYLLGKYCYGLLSSDSRGEGQQVLKQWPPPGHRPAGGWM